jgi:hypothetical protein
MVAADEIMLGVANQGMNFKPDDPVTREVGALVIMKAIHKLVPLDSQCVGAAFLDVPCGTGFYSFIQPLKNAGALTVTNPQSCLAQQPITDQYFRPQCNLRRADWARFLLLAMGLPTASPATPHYTDVLPRHVDFDYVEGAWAAGLVDVTSGAFRPEATLTRGEAALMAYNAIRIYYDLD